MVIWTYYTVTEDMIIFLFIFFTLFHMFDSNQHTTPLSNNVPNSWQIPEHTAYSCVVHEVNSHCNQYPSITWSCMFRATPLPYCVSCQAQFNAESCKPSYIGNMLQFNPNNITAHKPTNRQGPYSLFGDLQYRGPLIMSPSTGNYKFVCWYHGCYFASWHLSKWNGQFSCQSHFFRMLVKFILLKKSGHFQ